MFRRLLVANRGEIAARIIRACSKNGVETVAVHSVADADSPHLELADQTVCIGPGPASASYLNMDAILQAAEQTDCQALHPGFGFLAENALFAARVIQQQIAWIGPSPQAIACMGDKAQARRSMVAAGLPITPGTDGILDSLDEAADAAEEVGYPVLLKATAGGGGKGMRLCHDRSQLKQGFAEATLEAEKSFGNAGLYLEKAIVGARHIEFQVLGDAYGTAIHLGERECSVQRRHQKLLEEAPSPALDAEQRTIIGTRAAEATAAIGYCSAGTMEFLRDADGSFYFMEMNTRLQVEHPVTEMITGIDIVEQQLRVAANEILSISQGDVEVNGHAIELRINAEDPDDDFRPDPGEVTVFEPPSGDGIRLDTHVVQGYRIPPFYDSMIAKLIVHASTRNQAIERAEAALDAFRIEGVKTTIPIQRRILGEARFRDGSYDTGWLETMLAETSPAGRG
ncbi:MAG: acetyl-CoA carboxylase biotin carboxylase subunit [bacterium]|nr:acetyl-CoA carboxylase biotin carboxylase subunit [bacterium]